MTHEFACFKVMDQWLSEEDSDVVEEVEDTHVERSVGSIEEDARDDVDDATSQGERNLHQKLCDGEPVCVPEDSVEGYCDGEDGETHEGDDLESEFLNDENADDRSNE